VNELASHSHGVNDPGHSHTGTTGNPQNIQYSEYAGSAAGNTYGIADIHAECTNYISLANHVHSFTTNGAGTGISIQGTGSNNGHNNIQPSLVVNFVIKL
jgi:microcystin-dependent protein